MQESTQARVIFGRINRIAKLEHRSFEGQLLAMTELYEKAHNVSGKIVRNGRKKATKPATQKAISPEAPKRKQIRRRARSDIGKTRSEEAKKNIRIGVLKAKLKKRVAEEAQAH